MKERTAITLIFIAFLLFGGTLFYFTGFNTAFTFSKTDTSFVGNLVDENLVFYPDTNYHTLYRNFVDPISETAVAQSYIRMDTVACSAATAYYQDSFGSLHSSALFLANTESNEYGCSYGDSPDFLFGQTYYVGANYTLNPQSLLEYNGEHYIKFVMYSGGMHPFLMKGNNFNVHGDVIAPDFVMPHDQAIVYVHYEPPTLAGYDIIKVNIIDTFYVYWSLILTILIYISPAIICLVIWLLFGREKAEGDYPKELSQYPKERKTWEVCAYFHPPFGDLDQNFLPAMLMDFYNRKLIDIQVRKEGIFKTQNVYIKILQQNPITSLQRTNATLDDVEQRMLLFLKDIELTEKPTDGYFSIKHASTKIANTVAFSYAPLKNMVKLQSKEHLDYTGSTVLYSMLIVVGFIGYFSRGTEWLILFIPLIIAMLINHRSSLFIRFKDDYYMEYQQWQGFRKYLSTLDSIKRSPPQGVILWEKYLVYGTALGVGKNVLDAMKQLKVIDVQTYNFYSVMYIPASFGNVASPQGHGGGGFGGGGMGGGGGGGR